MKWLMHIFTVHHTLIDSDGLAAPQLFGVGAACLSTRSILNRVILFLTAVGQSVLPS